MSHTPRDMRRDAVEPRSSLSRRECIRMLGVLGLGSTVGAGTLAAIEASIDAARAAVTPGGVVPTLEFWIPNWPDMIEISRQLTEAWTKESEAECWSPPWITAPAPASGMAVSGEIETANATARPTVTAPASAPTRPRV